jgi:hypothetical protein
MDAAAKQITRTGLRYPEGWFLVFKQLRQKGGQCSAKYLPPKNPNCSGHQCHDGPPNAQDAKAHAASKWNMCRDWICRTPVNRAAEGFTVKAADGVWDRPQQPWDILCRRHSKARGSNQPASVGARLASLVTDLLRCTRHVAKLEWFTYSISQAKRLRLPTNDVLMRFAKGNTQHIS